MKNVKEILNVTKEGFTIKSTDLVDIINKFRKEEGKKTELQHNDFMKKIRKELKTLKTLGLGGQGNLSLAKYLDKQGKERECFELNRDGMLQMLNSESTYCRYKTIEYINELEDALNKTTKNYSLRMNNLTRLFLRTYPQEYESIAKEIMEYHLDLPKKLRTDKRHRKMDKTGYKQFVRDKLVQALEEIQKDINNKDIVSIRLYAKDLIIKLKDGLLETTNRSTGQLLSNKEKEIQYLDPQSYEYVTLDAHGFSNNYMYCYKENDTCKTNEYYKWIKCFPYEQVPEIDYWEDVDFTKPIEIFLLYVAKPKMDIRNFDKSILDMIFNRIYGIDDNIVQAVRSERAGNCNKFEDGKISFYIRNLREE